MKTPLTLLAALLLITTSVTAQKYMTKTGQIRRAHTVAPQE